MIGLICAFFIGKYFYKLAKDYNQNKLLFTILGVLVFYFGAILLGNLIIYYFTRVNSYHFSIFAFFGSGLLTMPFGIGCTCLFHYLLEKRLKKPVLSAKDEIEDIGKISEDN